MKRVFVPSVGTLVGDHVEMLVVRLEIAFNLVRAETPELSPGFQSRREQTLVRGEIDRVVDDEQPRRSELLVRTKLPPNLPIYRVDRIQRSVIG